MAIGVPRIADKIFLIIGGIRIEGFGGDGFVTFDRQSEPDIQIGVGGSAGVSIPANKSLVANVSVFENSDGYKVLSSFLAADERAGGMGIIVRNFSMSDANNGDTVTDNQAIIIRVAPPTKGSSLNTVEFRFFLPNPVIERAANL